jgi:EamA domain-containing membrane protein RarD
VEYVDGLLALGFCIFGLKGPRPLRAPTTSSLVLYIPPLLPHALFHMVLPIEFTQSDIARPSSTMIWVLVALAGILFVPLDGATPI